MGESSGRKSAAAWSVFLAFLIGGTGWGWLAGLYYPDAAFTPFYPLGVCVTLPKFLLPFAVASGFAAWRIAGIHDVRKRRVAAWLAALLFLVLLVGLAKPFVKLASSLR